MTSAAPANPFSHTVTPAQRLADTIVVERNLQPPVQIRDLVEELADVREARLKETGLDAVLHGLHGKDRPTLLIDEETAPTRTRFTLAHELGHLCMAWHQGTLRCHVDVSEPAEQPSTEPSVHNYEGEADQFASRLLIPYRYLETLDKEDPAGLLDAVELTGVSAEAAIYCLGNYLPPGYTFVLLDSYGRQAQSVARSRGTLNLTALKSQQFDEPYFVQFMQSHGHHKYGGSHIFWGRHEAVMELVETSEDWRTLLTRMLDEHGIDTASKGAGSAWLSINGIAGAAHSSVGHADLPLLAARIKQSIMRREEYAILLDHPLFDQYVSSRVRAFDSN